MLKPMQITVLYPLFKNSSHRIVGASITISKKKNTNKGYSAVIYQQIPDVLINNVDVVFVFVIASFVNCASVGLLVAVNTLQNNHANLRLV